MGKLNVKHKSIWTGPIVFALFVSMAGYGALCLWQWLNRTPFSNTFGFGQQSSNWPSWGKYPGVIASDDGVRILIDVRDNVILLAEARTGPISYRPILAKFDGEYIIISGYADVRVQWRKNKLLVLRSDDSIVFYDLPIGISARLYTLDDPKRIRKEIDEIKGLSTTTTRTNVDHDLLLNR